MAGDDITIRTINKEELRDRAAELVTLLRNALGGTVSASALPDFDREIEHTLANATMLSNAVTLIATRGDQLMGALFGHTDESRGFVRWVAVAPEFRRQGIATHLVDHFEQHTNIERIEGMVHLDDPTAVAFWTSREWHQIHPPRRRFVWGCDIARA